jgi:hypothetical protein
MKLRLFTSVLLAFCLLIFLGCYSCLSGYLNQNTPKDSNFSFCYFDSPSGNHAITRVIREDKRNFEVYYTYGRFSLKEIPKSYIRPKSVIGLDEGYDLLINWQDSVCTIYTCYGNYEIVGLNEVFKYERRSCNLSDTLWFDLLHDSINCFHEMSSNLPGIKNISVW